MSDESTGEFVLYTTEDGQTRIDCRFQDETIWLSQALMAELFETTPQNITLHLKALYEEGEIVEDATCKEYLQVHPGSQAPLGNPCLGEALLHELDSAIRAKDVESPHASQPLPIPR